MPTKMKFGGFFRKERRRITTYTIFEYGTTSTNPIDYFTSSKISDYVIMLILNIILLLFHYFSKIKS